ncbi:MAG: hypothetical protein IJP44_10735 [Bacteroidales bacterium]|nr:hypothetical protein [Bacteroidales bacterium]
MKAYKIFRWFLKASALTTVMFIMQACYGSPNMPPDMPDDMEMRAENDTLVSADEQVPSDLQSDGIEYEDLQSE